MEFSSKNVCNVIADFLCDDETENISRVCETARTGFASCPIRLVRRDPNTLPLENRSRIVSCDKLITQLCRGLSACSTLNVSSSIARDQILELDQRGLEGLTSLSVVADGQDSNPTDVIDWQIISKCVNLIHLKLKLFCAPDGVDKYKAIFSVLFDAGIRLKSLTVEVAPFGGSCGVKLHPENLKSLSLTGPVYIIMDKQLPDGLLSNLERLSLMGIGGLADAAYYRRLFAQHSQLTDLSIKFCEGSGALDHLSTLELNLDRFKFVDGELAQDLGKWTISRELDIHSSRDAVEKCMERCLPTLSCLGVWTWSAYVPDFALQVARFDGLDQVRSDDNRFIDLFMDCGSVTRLGILKLAQLSNINLPPNARHLSIHGMFKSNLSKLIHRRFWDSIVDYGMDIND